MASDKKQISNNESWMDFLSSNRLAIYSLITLAVISLIGTILPQRGPGLSEAQYSAFFDSHGFWGLAAKAGLLDIFRSVWFLGAFAVMCLNMVLCTILKFRRVYKTQTPADLKLDEALMAQMDKRIVRQAAVSPEGLRNHFRWQKEAAAESGKYYWSERGNLHRYGAIITHVGVLILAFGAIVGVLIGFNGMINVGEGEQADEVMTRSGDTFELPFQVRCDDFTVEFYEDGRTPKTFRSDITFVSQDGVESPQQNIEVNAPGGFGGFRFFQSSYGRMRSVGLRVVYAENGEVALEGKYRMGHTYRLPKDAGFFGIRSLDPNKFNSGPAAGIVEGLEGGEVQEFWIFKDNPSFDKSRGGTFAYELTGVDDDAYYTGLAVAKNPGMFWVWTGSAIMSIGICLAFFIPHKRILIRLEADRIIVAGRHSRGQNELEQYLNALMDKMTKSSESKGASNA